jgi:tetratricopeptide (TPR) repeat protein
MRKHGGVRVNYSVRLDAEELLALARQDVSKERYDEALLKLKQALADSSTREVPAEVLSELGRLNARLGLRVKARQAYQDFLVRAPDAVQERFELGLAFFEDKAVEPALKLWDEVLKRVPLHPPALFYSSLAHAQRGSFPEALSRSQALLAKVNSENLYYGRAKDLIQRIEADPNYRKASEPQASASSRIQQH